MITIIESKIFRAEAIINLINKYFNLNCRDLDRDGGKVIARQIAMYYIKKEIKLSYTTIGKLFPSKDSAAGYKGHDTVLYACRTVEGLIDVDKQTKEYSKDLIEEIKLISRLNIEDIPEYSLRLETIKRLKQLSESELKRVNLYLDHYFINRRP
jgi:hypothetical protein